MVLICEKKGILIINICNRFLTKSDVFDDVNEENELEENDINPIEDENNIFIKDIVETRLEFFRQNELLFVTILFSALTRIATQHIFAA